MKKLIAFLLFALPVLAQQAQTPNAPIFAVNAKYVEGVGVGYWPQAGAGLTLNIAAGRVRCGNAMTNYAGGTLTMANNTTNYVYLDSAASCAPGTNTTGYTPTLAAIATVVTASGVITTVTDDRTLGFDFKTVSGQPYELVWNFAGKPTSAATFLWKSFTIPVTFPANFTSSTGAVLTNAAATTVFTVKKNGTTVGTISVTTGTVTFATSGGTAVTVTSGDYFTIVTPTQDATLADVSFTLYGTR